MKYFAITLITAFFRLTDEASFPLLEADPAGNVALRGAAFATGLDDLNGPTFVKADDTVSAQKPFHFQHTTSIDVELVP